jgi:hypothetical protein
MRPRSKTGFLAMMAVLLAVAMVWTIDGQAQRGGGQGRGGAAAQEAPPVRIQVQVTQVKPDMVGTYQDLIKNELIPGLKKAGIAYRWTFAEAPAGQGFTFISVQPITNYAQFDQPGALGRAIGADGVANYNAKLRPTLMSQHTYVQTLNQNLSIQSNATAPPVLAIVADIQLLTGKGAEFNQIMTSDFLPNYKKAGVKDFWLYNTNFGGPAGSLVTVTPITKYADIDQGNPLALNRAGLSAEMVQQINARRNALIAHQENNIVRLVPELSFGMPTRRPATN